MESTLNLPDDLFLNLLPHLDFRDLGPLMCTSRHVHDLIETYKMSICKSIYLEHLVSIFRNSNAFIVRICRHIPGKDVPPAELDWVQEIKDLALLSARVRDSTDLNVSVRFPHFNTLLELPTNIEPNLAY